MCSDVAEEVLEDSAGHGQTCSQGLLLFAGCALDCCRCGARHRVCHLALLKEAAKRAPAADSSTRCVSPEVAGGLPVGSTYGRGAASGFSIRKGQQGIADLDIALSSVYALASGGFAARGKCIYR